MAKKWLTGKHDSATQPPSNTSTDWLLLFFSPKLSGQIWTELADKRLVMLVWRFWWRKSKRDDAVDICAVIYHSYRWQHVGKQRRSERLQINKLFICNLSDLLLQVSSFSCTSVSGNHKAAIVWHFGKLIGARIDYLSYRKDWKQRNSYPANSKFNNRSIRFQRAAFCSEVTINFIHKCFPAHFKYLSLSKLLIKNGRK